MCLPLLALAPIIGGAVAAGGAVTASVISSENARAAQEKGTKDAQAIQDQAIAEQRRQYDQSRADQMPWLQQGQASLADLARQMQAGAFDTKLDPSQIANDPGFQFRMAEGQKALERSAAARGGLASGNFMKGLAGYSQGLASDEYQRAWDRTQANNTNRYNRLAAMAGVGQTAAQGLSALGQSFSGQMGNYANNMSGLAGVRANAQSASAMNQGNAFGNAFNTLGGMITHGLSNYTPAPIPAQQGAPYYVASPQTTPNMTPAYGYGSPSYNAINGPW